MIGKVSGLGLTSLASFSVVFTSNFNHISLFNFIPESARYLEYFYFVNIIYYFNLIVLAYDYVI